MACNKVGTRAVAGLVLCTPITARLVQLRLKLPRERLRILPLNTPAMVRTALQCRFCR